MNAAWEVELLKLRRSTAARAAALVVAVGVPGLSAGFTAVGLAGGDSQMAVKVRPMLVGEGWAAYLGMVGQVMSIAMLLAAGVLVSWSFGREHADGTFGSLFAIRTPRHHIAGAKLAVLLLWGSVVGAAAVVVAGGLGAAIGLGPPGVDAARGAARILAVAVAALLLSLPLAWVASALRGPLPGITALLGVVVVTQVVTVAGAGAWFPYAAPGLWAGLGGAAAAASVTPLQLALVVPVGVLGGLLTLRWWRRAQVL